MILEAAMLQVRPGKEGAFEAAFRRASPLIAATDGYVSHELHRCLEAAGRCLLLVRRDTLEDHTVGFRESDLFVEWRGLLGHLFDGAPDVEHFVQVAAVAQPSAEG